MTHSPKRVLVVGGGLAGLACANRLHQAGVLPVVLEGGDAVGGRVRTDIVDGFLLDRGFQVFLDAYPESGKLLDKEALELQPFKPGALVWNQDRLHRVMDVFREPRHFLASALAPVGSLADKLKVALLRLQLTRMSFEEIADQDDVTTLEYLQKAGFSALMIDGFFRSFYGGIFLESDLRTSSRMFEFTFKMFSRGNATLPARGMGEIPRQLASRLPEGTLRLSTQVTKIGAKQVHLASGELLTGDAVVVATDATTAAKLVPDFAPSEPAWRSVTCLYFAANHSPLGEAIIVLNGSGSGLVNNVCVPSDIAPGYAPAGQALISISILGTPEVKDLEARTVTELESWFGKQVREWRHLRTERIQRALPDQGPGIGLKGAGFRQVGDVYVCGDHTWSASIEGAIISGSRTADAIVSTI
jgi:phytoene dehydrogenase-like protein